MSFRYMTGQEYLAVTRPWVNPAHEAHAVLMARPLTAAMVPDLVAAHDGLETVLHPPLAGPMALLTEQTVAKDDRHDNLLRCIDARLTAESVVISDPALAENLQSVRTVLLPEGLAIVNKAYTHEVGHAESVRAQLTSAQRSFLQTIPMHSGTLEDVVDDYLSTAEELGDLEHRRRVLGDDRPGRSAFAKARTRWVQAVNLVLHAAAMLGAEDRELQDLVAAAERAKQQAVERRRLRLADESPDGDGDGQNDGLDDSPGEPDGEPDGAPPADPDFDLDVDLGLGPDFGSGFDNEAGDEPDAV